MSDKIVRMKYPYLIGKIFEYEGPTCTGLAPLFSNTDLLGDPYVVVTVNKNKIYTTSIKHGTVDPTFEESTQVYPHFIVHTGLNTRADSDC